MEGDTYKLHEAVASKLIGEIRGKATKKSSKKKKKKDD